ncbi:ribonuclease domain-containing protein, partial [Saccharothrix sp. NPDC042600]|uniref:ribonuclease domain-containing protein n=1 Tax=Saccharothrix sp. NPDC042600 TaxID=3154492 RepID=UPI0033F55D13
AHTAATAPDAAAEADHWATQAAASAAEADQWAAQAAASADQATASAAQARAAAATATAAAATTQHWADTADASAAQAGYAAATAAQHAAQARHAATTAQTDADHIGHAYVDTLLAGYQAEAAAAGKQALTQVRTTLADSREGVDKLREGLVESLEQHGVTDDVRADLEHALATVEHLLRLIDQVRDGSLDDIRAHLDEILAITAQASRALPTYPEAIPDDVRNAAPTVRQQWLYQRWQTLATTPGKAATATRFGAAYCTEYAGRDKVCTDNPEAFAELVLEVGLAFFPYGRLAKLIGDIGYTALAGRGLFGRALQETAASNALLPGIQLGASTGSALGLLKRTQEAASASQDAGRLIPGAVLGDSTKLTGWNPQILPDETVRVIRDVERFGVEAQGAGEQFAGPSVWKEFANDGRSGGYRLPSVDSTGRRISYRELGTVQSASNPRPGGERIVTGSDGSIYYTGTHYQTFIVVRSGS